MLHFPSIRGSPRVQKARERKFWLNRRSKHLLTGLSPCGDCGAPLAAAGKDYLSCSAGRRLGTCKNRKGIRRAVLEGLILDALRHNLMHADFVAEFIREFHAEVNRLRRDAEVAINFKRRELEETCRKLDGLIEAIAEGFRAPRLQAKLDELEQSKARLRLPGLMVRLRRRQGSIPTWRNSIGRRSPACRTRSLIPRPKRRRSRFFAASSIALASAPTRMASRLNSSAKSPTSCGSLPARKAWETSPTEVR